MMDIDPCLAFGIDPTYSGVGVTDRVFISELLHQHPEWVNIVEFGTHCGITSTLLARLIRERAGTLHTIDNDGGSYRRYVQRWPDNAIYYDQDLLTHAPVLAVADLIRMTAPCLLVIDDGNKPKECQSYIPFVCVGSAFVVHDFGTTSTGPNPDGEVCWDDICDTLAASGEFVPVLANRALALRSLYRCWSRVR